MHNHAIDSYVYTWAWVDVLDCGGDRRAPGAPELKIFTLFCLCLAVLKVSARHIVNSGSESSTWVTSPSSLSGNFLALRVLRRGLGLGWLAVGLGWLVAAAFFRRRARALWYTLALLALAFMASRRSLEEFLDIDELAEVLACFMVIMFRIWVFTAERLFYRGLLEFFTPNSTNASYSVIGLLVYRWLLVGRGIGPRY